jgi:hypothetical protein
MFWFLSFVCAVQKCLQQCCHPGKLFRSYAPFASHHCVYQPALQRATGQGDGVWSMSQQRTLPRSPAEIQIVRYRRAPNVRVCLLGSLIVQILSDTMCIVQEKHTQKFGVCQLWPFYAASCRAGPFVFFRIRATVFILQYGQRYQRVPNDRARQRRPRA